MMRCNNGFALPYNVAGNLCAKSGEVSNSAWDKKTRRELASEGPPTLHGNLPTLVPPNFWTIQPSALVLLRVIFSVAMVNDQRSIGDNQYCRK
jgi:hypothetical protein